MFKRIFTLTLSLAVILSFAACGEKTEVIEAENKTEAAAKSDITEAVSREETTLASPQTEITRIDRPVANTSKPKKSKISAPNSAVYYSDGQQISLPSNSLKAITDKVNYYLENGKTDVPDLFVIEKQAVKNKSKQKCIELIYKTEQKRQTIAHSSLWDFDKLLIILDGKDKGLIIHAENGVYTGGAVTVFNESFTKDILNILNRAMTMHSPAPVIPISDSAVYYSGGQRTTLTKEQSKSIISRVNTLFTDDRIDIAKLAVTKDLIPKIKAEQKCVELIYNSEQKATVSCASGNYSKSFNKILIVLDDDYKNLIFFETDNVYQNGYIMTNSKSFANDILNIVK